MANNPQELAQDAVCQSHTGHMTGLWFLPARPLRLNTNECVCLYRQQNFAFCIYCAVNLDFISRYNYCLCNMSCMTKCMIEEIVSESTSSCHVS